jgi:hypothetical protein
MRDYRFEGPDPAGMIDDLIREHGPTNSVEIARQKLLAVMEHDEVSQLNITASVGASPNTFDVAIDGPPRLVRKAVALVRSAPDSP